MPPSYNRHTFKEALQSLGVAMGDVLFSHSNIGFFGLPEEGRTAEAACRVIRDGFFDALGPTGTLVVPTFTYSFPKGESFDPDLSPSTCGIFTEFIRTLPGSQRSEDPCVSVSAIGHRAEELTSEVPENSYGPGSFFERLHLAGGKICNMNFDAGSTFLHYVERELKVPYRFDKTFEGTIRKRGRKLKKRSTIWVRNLSSDDTVAAFEPFNQLATQEGLYRRREVGRGFIGVIDADDVFELLRTVIPRRPWLLTKADERGTTPKLVSEN